MKVIQVLDRPASQSFYAVAGRLLFIQSSDLELATRIERLFAGWQLTPLSSLERSPDIKISFVCGDLPHVPSGLSEFEVAEGGRCYMSGDEYYLQFEGTLLKLQDKNPVSVSVFICDPTDAELARVTSFAVCAALRRFGLFELHAGGVVEPNSQAGALIIGPSGSGKSTLTTHLARAGWGYLSDDELLLSLNDNEVEARGFRSFFALVDSTSTLKNCFEPAGMFTSPRVDNIAPRFVFLTKVSGEKETQLHELRQAETMTRLIRACPWASYDTAIAAANLELLSRLARQTKGFDLAAGKDLLEPETASRIISYACHQ
ncbi:MAG: hypothetical protein LC794_12545 [Acidobacteria bacterium]|nr:hypothetical protein [Acidobacteriota bacterium]MCA1627497.1 hypothetical protein [Acidobacteriota bacterium]